MPLHICKITSTFIITEGLIQDNKIYTDIYKIANKLEPTNRSSNVTQCSIQKRGDICIHITDPLCCVTETNITL